MIEYIYLICALLIIMSISVIYQLYFKGTEDRTLTIKDYMYGMKKMSVILLYLTKDIIIAINDVIVKTSFSIIN